MKKTRFAALLIVVAAVLAACSGTASGGSTVDAADADYSVTAVDMAFDSNSLSVAGGEAFTLALVNEDSMPHNIAIYTDESKSEKVFEGEVVTDGTIVYEIPALEAGEYFFDCSLHPDMTGSIVVEA